MEYSKRMDKPNVESKNLIRPTPNFTKRNVRNSTKIQCIYLSNESTTEPKTEHASIPPPSCKK